MCLSGGQENRQVNPTTDLSFGQIFFCLSFTFIACTALGYIYTYVIIAYFIETKSKIMKALIAALTPGIVLLPTAIGKYLALRRSLGLFPIDKAFVICYFLRGGVTAIDFSFNIVSIFIQVHFYDIPMRRVWLRYWRRHMVANILIIVNMVSYFGSSLVSAFEAREDMLREYPLRNCTSAI